MNIKNPTIADICCNDFITIKNSITELKGWQSDKSYRIYNCDEEVEIASYKGICRYFVKDIDYSKSIVIVRGQTKEANPYYDKTNKGYKQYISIDMMIDVNDIDTVYSQKTGDRFIDNVFKAMSFLLFKTEPTLKEYLGEMNTECWTCESGDDICHLSELILQGSEKCSDIRGIYADLETYFYGKFFVHGETIPATEHYTLVWKDNAVEYKNDIAKSLKDMIRLMYIEYEDMLKLIKTNKIGLDHNVDVDNIVDRYTKFYEWLMNVLCPLIDTNLAKVHNSYIDDCITDSEYSIKSALRIINQLSKSSVNYNSVLVALSIQVETLRNKIDELKRQYK